MDGGLGSLSLGIRRSGSQNFRSMARRVVGSRGGEIRDLNSRRVLRRGRGKRILARVRNYPVKAPNTGSEVPATSTASISPVLNAVHSSI